MTVDNFGWNTKPLGKKQCKQPVRVAAVNIQDIILSVLFNDPPKVESVFDRIGVIEAGQNAKTGLTKSCGKRLFFIGAYQKMMFKAIDIHSPQHLIESHL